MGGGVYSDIYTQISIEPGSYSEVVDGVKKTLESNVTVTGNRGDLGAGIAVEVDMGLSGGAELSGNQNGDDIRIGKGLRIVCGALTYKKPVGVSFFEFYYPNTELITSGFGANNKGRPEQYFFCPDPAVKVNATSAENGAVKLNLNMEKTVVEVFEKGNLTKTEEFDSPEEAWTAAKNYCKKNYFELLYEVNDRTNRAGAHDFYPKYQTKRSDFDDWYDAIVDTVEGDEQNKGKYTHNSMWFRGAFWVGEAILHEDYKVRITLGSDWKVYGSQTIDWFTDPTFIEPSSIPARRCFAIMWFFLI